MCVCTLYINWQVVIKCADLSTISSSSRAPVTHTPAAEKWVIQPRGSPPLPLSLHPPHPSPLYLYPSIHSRTCVPCLQPACFLPFFQQTHYGQFPTLILCITPDLSLYRPSPSYNSFYQYFTLVYFSFSSLSCFLSLKISRCLALLFSLKHFHIQKKKVRGGKDDAEAYLFWTIRKSDEADDFSRFGSRPAARNHEWWSMVLSYRNSKTKGRKEAMHYVATNQSHGKTSTAGHNCQTDGWVIIWLIINYYLGFWTKAQPAKGWQWQGKTNEAWKRDNTKRCSVDSVSRPGQSYQCAAVVKAAQWSGPLFTPAFHHAGPLSLRSHIAMWSFREWVGRKH